MEKPESDQGRINRLEKELAALRNEFALFRSRFEQDRLITTPEAPEIDLPDESLDENWNGAENAASQAGSSPPPPQSDDAPPIVQKELVEHIEWKSEFDFDTPSRSEKSSEYWLSRIGVGLFLFGVAFLFKYSIDQGWITPPWRIAFGVASGIILTGAGWRVYETHRGFGQGALGGGIALFFVSLFAAYNLYDMLTWEAAFVLMALITGVGVAMALVRNDAALSSLAGAGGMGAPLLIRGDEFNITFVVAYVSLLLAGLGAIYFIKGWRSLLALSFVAGGALYTYLAASLGGVAPASSLLTPTHSVELGVIFWFLSVWVIPLARRRLQEKKNLALSNLIENEEIFANKSFDLFITTLAPLSFWGLSSLTFGWSFADAGKAALILSGIMALFTALLYDKDPMARAWIAPLFGAVILAPTGLYLAYNSQALMAGLAAEAGVLIFIGGKSRKEFAAGGHLLFLVAALILTGRLMSAQSGAEIVVNEQTFFDLLTMGFGVAVAWRLGSTDDFTTIYVMTLWAALMLLTWRELGELSNGEGYVTGFWGLMAVAALVAGFIRGGSFAMNLGLATIAAVVLKLFMVDLRMVETHWRIILFLVFGASLLALSYFGRRLRRTRPEELEI